MRGHARCSSSRRPRAPQRWSFIRRWGRAQSYFSRFTKRQRLAARGGTRRALALAALFSGYATKIAGSDPRTTQGLLWSRTVLYPYRREHGVRFYNITLPFRTPSLLSHAAAVGATAVAADAPARSTASRAGLATRVTPTVRAAMDKRGAHVGVVS